MKKANTRRALLLSALALLVCMSMLVGSTFAWFTDSVVSANNIIKSGNLDVVLEYKTNWNDTWAEVQPDTKLFSDSSKYEPGFTEVVFLRVSNAGSLALKYNLKVDILSETPGVNVAGEEFKLSDYLEIGSYTQAEYNGDANYADILMPFMFGTRESALANLTASNKLTAGAVLNSDGPVEVGDKTAQIAVLVLNMPETVGNEANHNGTDVPKINLGVTLLATQLVSESDSFGPEYDEDATYPVVVNDNAGLEEALNGGEKNIKLAPGTYTLPSNQLTPDTTLTCEPGTVFEGSPSMNVNGATIDGATFANEGGNAVAQSSTVNGTFKNCTFSGSNATRYLQAGETVVFENCVFDGAAYGVHFDGGANDVTFKNCTFSGFNAFGSALTKLTLDGCTFKAAGNSNYNGVNLWGATDLIDCTFVFDGSTANEWCDARGESTKTITFTNCVVTDGTNTQTMEAWGNVGVEYPATTTVVFN